MQLDPSIIMGYKPIEVPDQSNMLMKAMQLQQMQQQGEVARMQMDQHRNELMRQAGIDQFFKGLAPGSTPDQITSGLRGAGYGKEALTYEDKAAGIAKDKAQTANYSADAEAKKTQAMSAIAQALSTKPGGVLDSDIMRYRDIAVRSGWTTPEDFAHDFRDLPQNPADRATYMGMSAKAGVSAAEQLKQQTTQQQMEMTDRHQRATEGLTARGQNMVDARAKQSLGVQREGVNLQREAARTAVIEGGEGIGQLLVDKATGQSRPIIGADGQPIVTKKPGKAIPQFVVEGVTKNAQAISTIDKALAELKTSEGANAVGYKGYMPNSILNRVDPQGVGTRANIADVGSMQIKNRSGATVTAAEEPRLLPFIPLPTDDAATAKKKLTRLREVMQAETDALTEFYPEAAKPLQRMTDKATAAPALPAGWTAKKVP